MMVSYDGPVSADGERYAGRQISNVIDSLNSGFAYFTAPPSLIAFGQREEKLFTLDPGTFVA